MQPVDEMRDWLALCGGVRAAKRERGVRCGSTPAMTCASLMPSSAATEPAVVALSPVTIQTSMPRRCKAATAATALGLSGSDTVMAPQSLPSRAASTAVMPCLWKGNKNKVSLVG